MDRGDTESDETAHLLARLQAGHSGVFDRLFEQYRGYLQRVIGIRFDSRLSPRVDVSDVVQETQIEAARRIRDYLDRQPMPFRLWLRKTAQQCLMKTQKQHLTAEKRSVRREVNLSQRSSMDLARMLQDPGSTPSERANRGELTQRVRRAVAALPEAEREVILMLDLEGLSSKEAAYILDLNPSTVNRRHGRALLRLQRALLETGLTESQL
jgi:RNA polymerase sigma-70 factor (ECF subfamily)